MSFLTPPIFYHQLGGDDGVWQTLQHMANIVNESFTNPWIIERARTIVSHCRRNLICENRALQGWVNGSMQYVRDPTGVESLFHPVSYVEASIRNGQKPGGDCDDLSTYLAALLKAVGHSPQFKVVSKVGSDFHHVLVYCDGYDLDPTLSYSSHGGANEKEGYFRI